MAAAAIENGGARARGVFRLWRHGASVACHSSLCVLATIAAAAPLACHRLVAATAIELPASTPLSGAALAAPSAILIGTSACASVEHVSIATERQSLRRERGLFHAPDAQKHTWYGHESRDGIPNGITK